MAKAATKKSQTMEVEVKNDTKELQVQDSTGKALATGAPTNAMADQGFDMGDIVLPRILLMQSQSDLVAQKKAKPGDYLNSLTGEILGGEGKSFEIIPLFCAPKSWHTSEKGPRDGKPKWKKVQSEAEIMKEYGVQLAKDVPWEEELPGRVMRFNKRTLNFYVLVKSEVEAGEGFPYMLSFQSTAYNVGKKLATHFMKCGMLRAQPYDRSMKLSSFGVSNDQGNFFNPVLESGDKTLVDVREVAANWLPVVKSANVKVDAAEKPDPAGAPAPSSPESEDDLPY